MSIVDQNLTSTNTETLAMQGDNIKNLAEISKNSRTTFMTMLVACIYCYLTIASTTDASLLTNSSASPLPIISTRVPIVWFYYFAPPLLLLVFVYFHLYMRRFWRCVAKLPLIHDDGRRLDDYIYPWLISAAIIRAEIPELRSKARHTVQFESAISIFLAWWFIPLVLVFFWARYLPAHDWVGTSSHVVLIALAVSSAVHFYSAAKKSLIILKGEKSVTNARYGAFVTSTSGLLVGATLLFVSYGSIRGAPSNECTRTESNCRIVHSGVRMLEQLGYNPFVNIEHYDLSGKPEDWTTLLSGAEIKNWLDSITGPKLSHRDLRFANADSSFLAGANFVGTDMRWIRLENSILVGANLSDAQIQNGRLSEAQLQWSNMSRANLDRADLAQANLKHARLEKTILSEVSLYGADLQNAIGPEAQFVNANLISANFKNAEFPNARFNDAQLQRADMENGEFEAAIFNGARLQFVLLENALLNSAEFVGSDLQESQMSNADLFRANFTNANLDFSELQRIHAREADFSSAVLTNANLRDADLRATKFVDANLTYADLTSADLSAADFTKALLVGVEFKDAQLYLANFEDAILDDADVSSAIGLDVNQLKNACGNKRTKLPLGFTIRQCTEELNVVDLGGEGTR